MVSFLVLCKSPGGGTVSWFICTTPAGRLLRACVTGDAWATPSDEVVRFAAAALPAPVAAGAAFHGISGYVTSALRAAETGPAIVEAVQPAYYRGIVTHLQTLADLALLDTALRAYDVPFVVI